jgi:CRP-like cAMP-binding protein
MTNSPVWLRLFRPRVDWVEDACGLCEKNPLFEQIPHRSVRRLVSRMHRRSYKAGETIVGMGNAGAGAVLVLSGEAEVSVGDVELERMRRGDLFGEVALVADLPRTAEVTAVEDCELLFFLRSDLQEWLAIMPKEAARLLQNLATMLGQKLMAKNISISRQDSDE